jgi:hypothetical protein
MTRDQGRALAGILGLVVVVVTALVAQADTFHFSDQVKAALVILNGALAYVINYLPNLFRAEPAPLPGNPNP